jgi:hypothetical protein
MTTANNSRTDRNLKLARVISKAKARWEDAFYQLVEVRCAEKFVEADAYAAKARADRHAARFEALVAAR